MRRRTLAVVERFLLRRPAGWVSLGAAFVVLDFFTGPYVLFPVTFVLPVLFAAWQRRLGWALLLSGLLPLLRLAIAWSEGVSGPPAILVLNMLIRTAVLGLVAVLVVKWRELESVLLLAREHDRIAGEIQQRLLPTEDPELAGFDIAGFCEQAQAVGGDYFDYLPMPAGRLGIAVGDVCGHGLGPALLMAATRAYVRGLAQTRADVGEILTLANRLLYDDTDSRRFVTLWLGCLDARGRTLSYAAAGHAGYVLESSGRVKKLDRTGMAIGIDRGSAILGAAIDLSPGDVLLVFSDGFPEARSPAGELFGPRRMLRVAREYRGCGAREIVQALFDAVHEFTSGQPAGDDMTAVVIRVLSPPEPAQCPPTRLPRSPPQISR